MSRTLTAVLAAGTVAVLAACTSNGSTATPADPTTPAAATSNAASAGPSSPASAAATAAATVAATSAAPATSPAAVPTSAAPSVVVPPSIPATVTSPGSKPTTPTAPVRPTTRAPVAVPGGHCLNGQLQLTLAPGSPGAGQIYTSLVFTNTSTSPCTLAGHPGVSYVAGSDGHQVGTPAAQDAGASATVTLAAGGTASATLHEVNYQNFDQGVCKPVPTEGLRVYPPGSTRSFFLRRPATRCSATGLPDPAISVGVVKPGAGG